MEKPRVRAPGSSQHHHASETGSRAPLGLDSGLDRAAAPARARNATARRSGPAWPLIVRRVRGIRVRYRWPCLPPARHVPITTSAAGLCLAKGAAPSPSSAFCTCLRCPVGICSPCRPAPATSLVSAQPTALAYRRPFAGCTRYTAYAPGHTSGRTWRHASRGWVCTHHGIAYGCRVALYPAGGAIPRGGAIPPIGGWP